MRKIWTELTIDAPASDVWAVLTDTERWAEWGPSVRRAELDGERFEQGATGTVTTALGASVPFEITRCEPNTRWAWKVAGIDATDHVVKQLDDESCEARFGVPWIVAPYLAVCQVALRRIKTMAEQAGAQA